MKLRICLCVLAVVSTIYAQSIPQFEPLFSSNTVETTINERPQLGDEVITTRARGLGGETIVYGLDLPSNALGVFAIDSETGVLTVGPNGPDRLLIIDNTPVSILAEVFAYYNSSGSAGDNRAYLFVRVEVRDINDPPSFGSETRDIPTSETTAVGATVTRVTAVDHDLSNNGVVTYTLEQIAPSGQATFVINEFTGDLILAQSLDLNVPYQLRIIATDQGVPQLSSTLTANVQVAPVPPTFLQNVYNANISEFTGQVPVTVITVQARDSSPHTPGTVIVYSVGTVIPATTDVTFNVGRSTGVVTVNGTVDRETHSRYLVLLQAYESGHDAATLGAGTATVVVTINDVNEPPEFLSSHYTTVISEGAGVGDTLFNGLAAVDFDEGSNSALTYSITMVTGLQTIDGESVTITDPFFLIDSVSGVLTVNTNLEREAVVDGYHYYEMIVTVSDSGVAPLTATTLLAITVADINDNPPIFNDASLTFSVPENELTGTIVGEFTVSDRDQGSAAELSYSLQGPSADRFNVRTLSVTYSTTVEAQPPVITRARVYTSESLDREETETYQFTLVAQDLSQSPLSASIPLNITVDERNDNEPLFTSSSFTFTIPEDTNTTFISEFMVSDADIGSNGEVDFFLEASTNTLFSLVRTGPFLTQLHFGHAVNREMRESYSFRIFAMDRGTPALIGDADILINITDVNDNAPVFQSTLYEATVIENTAPGLLLTTVLATDLDIGGNQDIIYTAVNQSLIAVNSSSGAVTLASPPDFEMGEIVDIQIVATDMGDQPLSGQTTLRLTIVDVNDNPPVFVLDRFNVSVSEEVAVGSQFDRIVATDADSGDFGQVVYSIVNSSVANTFRIDNATGFLTTERVLDRETDPTTYTLVVGARDNGNPPMSSEVYVDVELSDVNDNTPYFVNEPYVTEVDEGFNESAGVFVYMVTARDDDIGTNSQIEYSLAGQFVEFFTVDRSTGAISVSSIGVDYEAVQDDPVITLTVIATDRGTSPRLATTSINITVLDGNDNAPEFVGLPYSVSIPETNSTARTRILTVMATDLDAGPAGEVQFMLAGGDASLFEIDRNSGEIFLPAGVYFDREIETIPHNENGDAVYRFGVAANDRGSPQQVSFATVTLLITDVNDNSPMFPEDTISIAISESLPISTAVLNLVAIDNDFGINAQLAYSIVLEETDAGSFTEDFIFFVDADSGVLSLAQGLDRETLPEISLIVTATDQGLGNNQDNVTIFINVTDANDNRPIFVIPPGGYVGSVSENSPPGTEVITVMATDLDQGSHQSISYTVLSNVTGTSVPFEIQDPASGLITLSGSVDRETTPEYQLLVVASDSASNPGNVQQTFATVRVSILDVNDNIPAFGAESYRGTVDENSALGSTVQLTPPLSASDADTSAFFFSLLGNSTELFVINSTTGVITTNESLDFELRPEYSELILQVSDGLQLSSVPLVIAVSDVNDNPPVFDPDTQVLPVSESTTPVTEITVAMATDADMGQNAMIVYSIETEGFDGLFTIDPLSGIITVNSQLDFETQDSYMLTVTALDLGDEPLNGTLAITVVVTDVNDNAPIIQNPNPSFSIIENSMQGAVVGVVNAMDADSGSNGELLYSIIGGNDMSSFEMNATTGVISVIGVVDREAQDRYEILVQVVDSTEFPLSDQTTVTVIVEDVNDNTPVFQEPSFSVNFPEGDSLFAEVIVVEAMDADIGNNSELVFSIVSQEPEEHFIIDESTGSVTTNASLDYETVNEYQLTILVRDQGSPALYSNTTLTVSLIDLNDNTPLFEGSPYTATIAENSANGSIVETVRASDLDSNLNGQVMYSIDSVIGTALIDDVVFQIDSSSGVVTVFDSVLIDLEKVQTYHVQIQATDLGSPARSSQALLSITLTDVNDNAPQFDGDTPNVVMVTEGASPGTIITVIRATDEDQGINAAIIYSITGGNTAGLFRINTDGALQVNGLIDFESQPSHDLVIEAMDQGSPPLATTFDLTVVVLDINDNTPSFPTDFPNSIDLSEDAPVNTELGKLSIIDADNGENGRVTLRIVNQAENTPFNLSPDSGSLTLVSSVDRETVPQYSLIIEATDNGTPAMSAQATFTINVLDVNDNLPVFESSPVFTIRENQTPGIVIGRIDTTDGDEQKEAYYFIIGGTDGIFLNVEPTNGNIFLRTNVDFEAGQTLLTALVAAVSTNNNPGSSCTVTTCSVVTLTVNVEDWNDNAPVLPEYDFGVNQSSPLNTVIGQINAVDLDTGDFGTVRYEFPNMQPKFSINSEDGTIRLAEEFNVTADDKYNTVPVVAYDNPDNRQLSFSTPSIVRIYFVEESELVIVTVSQTLAEVQNVLDPLRSSLAGIGGELSVYVFDIQEYTVTIDLSTPSPTDAPQKRQILETQMVNITLFAVNQTSVGILSSDEFLSELSGAVESIVDQFLMFDGIVVYPLPPTPPPDPLPVETILLILYIVVGTLGGLVLFIVLLLCCICCVLTCKKRRQSYVPGITNKKGNRPQSNISNVSGISGDKDAYQNPLWIDPYGNWSDDVEKGAVQYRERSPDEALKRDSEEIRDSVLYDSQDFVMANFSEQASESEDEEAMVEIKPDTQSLSQQSTGDSTFERRRSDRVPLVRKQQKGERDEGRAWEDDDMRASAELELTADQDEDETESDGDEEYTDDDDEEETGSSEEEEEEGEEGSTEGSSGSEEEEEAEEEYDYGDDPNFPENGFPELADNEYPLMF